MCGIAGIWSLNDKPLALNSLVKFTDALKHRGPDGSGYELLHNGTLGFGHRRLSILDLSEAGKQPMFSKENDLVISFNGEVYNFIEIRNELINAGEKFVSETDTEVILRAYKKWGKDCLSKFNGMFAIAIWDVKNEELFLARDRFGVKPLFYFYIPHTVLAFASETIAYKHLDDFVREINPKIFNIALTNPETIEGSDKTIFKNLYQLKPGHFLTINKNEGPKIKQWWNTSDNFVNVPSTYEKQVEEFTDLFEDACKIRMRSDVTLASALSGGLDSSSVYCTLHKIAADANMKRLPANWQQAFVATFPNTTVDEKHYAEKVVKHINGKAYYIIPDYSNLVNEIVNATKLFDGLIATPITSISTIYKAMKENGATVSMDGHGVDEMMYGYNNYVFQAFYEALHKKDFLRANEYAQILCGLSPDYKIEELKKIIKQFDKNLIEKSFSFLKNRMQVKRAGVTNTALQPSWTNPSDDSIIAEINSFQKEPAGWSNSEKTMYSDFHYKSLPINLRDFDRAAMQHGVEIRMPFMDYRLVSYVFSLPKDSKIGGGFTKRILRDAMKKTLPEDIRTRTLKIGIGAPMVEWFNGELKEFVFDTLRSDSFQNSSLWNGKQISEDLTGAYKENKINKAICSRAWSVINAHLIINDNQ